MKNRIRIVNWRRHGDDESYCYLNAYGAKEDRDIVDDIRSELDIPDDPDGDAESRGDYKAVIYVTTCRTVPGHRRGTSTRI